MFGLNATLVHTALNGAVGQRVKNRNDEIFGKVAAKRYYSPGQLLNLKLEVFPGSITNAEDREVCLTKRPVQGRGGAWRSGGSTEVIPSAVGSIRSSSRLFFSLGIFCPDISFSISTFLLSAFSLWSLASSVPLTIGTRRK